MSKLSEFSKKAYHYSLHLVLAMLLVNWVVATPTFHGIGIYELALLALGCSALVRLYFEKGGVFRAIAGVLRSARWTVIAVAVYVLLGEANILYSPNPDLALDKYITVVQLVFVGVCMLYHIADRPDARRGLYLNVGITAIIIALVALGKYLFTGSAYEATISACRDYNLYSTILLMGWICAITYCGQLNTSNERKCKLLTLFTAVLMPMVLVSGSRRSYLIAFGVAAAILVYAILLTIKSNTPKRAISTLLVCVLCVGLTSFGMTKAVYTLSHEQPVSQGQPQEPSGPASAKDRLEADPGFGKRTVIWKAALKEIERFDTKELLIGKGASYSSDYYDDLSVPEVQAVHEAYNKSPENPAKKNWMNTHNLLLQDMLDGGIVLLLSLLAVIGMAVFYCIRLIRTRTVPGIGISLLYSVLLLTLLLSSGRGMLVNKFFWLITFFQLLECYRLETKKGI